MFGILIEILHVSKRNLFSLFDDEAYRVAYVHRRAAIERQRVVAVHG